MKSRLPQFVDEFPSALTEDDLITSASTSCLAGEAKRLGVKEISKGEAVMFGQGKLAGQNTAVGRAYASLKNSTTQLHGLIRLAVYSAQDRLIKIISEYRTEELLTSSTDRTQKMPFAEVGDYYEEGRKLVLEFIADTAVTVIKADSDILFSITQFVE